MNISRITFVEFLARYWKCRAYSLWAESIRHCFFSSLSFAL